MSLAIVNPKGTSSKSSKCDSKGLEETDYRKLRCSKCGFEADNIRKVVLKILGISGDL
jgi:transposase